MGGNVDPDSKYAWSTNVGWINFDPTHGGVSVDLTSGSLDGYAWGASIGWIHFKKTMPAAYNVAVDLADLSIAKSVMPSAAAPGDTITYTLTFSNGGSGAATDVVITDTIPISVVTTLVVSSGAAITDTGASPGYEWAVQDLAPGQGGVITIAGVLGQGLSASPFTNTATIGTSAIDADPGDNSADAVVTVLAQEPALSVVKSVQGAGGGALDLPLGGVVTYTIVLANDGAGIANSVVMTDPLPAPVSFGSQVQGSALLPLAGGVYQWGPYDVAAHTAYTITFTAELTDSADFAGQTVTNTAYAGAANAALASGDASFTVEGKARIYLPLVARDSL
jgi:uncharacterized repeat protein (TIGR01451 family)